MIQINFSPWELKYWILPFISKVCHFEVPSWIKLIRLEWALQLLAKQSCYLKMYFGALIKCTKDVGGKGIVLDDKYAKAI